MRQSCLWSGWHCCLAAALAEKMRRNVLMLTRDVCRAVWEDKEAALEFLKSKAAKKFLEYTLENNVYLTTTVLYPIEASD